MKQILWISLFVLFASVGFAGEWFVAPGGDDDGPGTKEKPFASLVRARDAVRAAKDSQGGPHVVHLSEGVFELSEPIVFDQRDSGTPEHPVRYVGSGKKTLLSGGRVLNGWEKINDEVWSIEIPKENGRDLYFEQLFVNGRRAVRARTPNNGFFRPQDIQQEHPISPKAPSKATTKQSIMPQKGDLDFLKTTPSEELRFGQFVVHHHWDTTRRILLGYNVEADLLLMQGAPMKHWNPWRITSLYYIENVRAAFDEPGEWFYDGVGHKVFYRPLFGEKLENCCFHVPRSGLSQILLVKGTKEQRASNIRFEKIAFAYTDSPRREGVMKASNLDPAITGDLKGPGPGQIDPVQAAFWANAVIDIENAEEITLADCEISNIGEYGLWLKNSDRCRVERCAFTELGAGGVRIGGVGSSKNNVVDNCIFHRGGRLHASAVAIWLGNGTEDNQVTHNEIADFYYTGISAGWTWGYKGGVAFRNIIEFNRIHDIGQGVMADMGGVYTLGTSHGTRVCNNVIFNVLSYAYGGWGLYTDEGSEGILMENNLVYDTSDGSFHQHYGKNNTVRNNILAFSQPHQVAVTRIENHLSMTFENNILYWNEGKAIGYRADKVRADYGSNLWFCVTEDGKPGEVDFNSKTHKDWQDLGKDVGGIIADPKFIDPKKRDFRLQEDSPIEKIGFVPFDFSKAGVYGDEHWVRRAKDLPTPIAPNIPPPPNPLPFKLVDGFETLRFDPLQKGNAADRGKNLIRLSKDRPAQGESCLEVTNTTDGGAVYNPYLHYSPRYEQGEIRIGFSLRVQKNAELYVELRDRSIPYRVGPRFRIAKETFAIDGMEPIALPKDAWVRFEIETTVGDSSTGTWTLILTFPDGGKKVFDDVKFKHSDWKSLDWFGLCGTSKTTENASFFLDDIEIGNK